MVEAYFVDRNVAKPGYEVWLNDLSLELGHLAIKPDAPFSGAFAAATLNTFRVPRVQYVMARFHAANPDRSPPESVRMLRASAAAQLSHRPGYTYPDHYDKVRSWLSGMEWIYNTYPYAQRYNEALTKWDLSTPVSQRYVEDTILGNILEHLIGPDPRRLDIGCSDNSGNVRALQQTVFPFDPLRVVRTKRGVVTFLDEKTDIMASIIAHGNRAKRIVGLDKIDPNDPIVREWIIHCLTPEEHYAGSVTDLNDALVRAEVGEDRLGFRQADITSARDVTALLEAEGGPFDVVSSYLSWYQGSAAKRRKKFDAITQRLVRPGGVAYFVDFARRSDGRGEYMSPLRSWVEMNVLVWHKGKIYRVGAYTDGRAHQRRVFKELALLARGGRFEREVDDLVAEG